MEKIFINVDSYNNEGIKTIQGNNNAETYKIYLLKNKIRLSLVNKTVKLGYVMAGTTKGDIIEDLNITNAEQGEITFPITNKISKKDGVYTCQLAIYGSDGFLEYTATFGLTVQANIFNKIANEIADNKDLTYIERILEEAINTSEELKSNIPVARQLNIDLENQNRILNENMDRANGVNNTLITTTEQSKVAATDAIEKKSQLESSIVEAKKFIDGLDGSQNIPQLRLDVMELQNGLKSNQALSYEGSSISANDTLEGRTEGMKIGGRTLQNLIKDGKGTFVIDKSKSAKRIYEFSPVYNLEKGKKYKGYIFINNVENTAYGISIYGLGIGNAGAYGKIGKNTGIVKFTWNTSQSDVDSFNKVGIYIENTDFGNGGKATFSNFMLFEEETDLTYIDEYFEGIKSFGEAEQERDKYKISILSHCFNLFNYKTMYTTDWIDGNGSIINSGDNKYYSIKVPIYKTNIKYYITGDVINRAIVGYLDADGRVISHKVYSPLKTIELDVAPKGAKYILAYLNAQGYDNSISNGIMLSIDTPSEYLPYSDLDKKDILIKEPLQGLDENTCDIMYEDNGQVKVDRVIEQHIFTGDETIKQVENNSKAIIVIVDGIKGIGSKYISNQNIGYDVRWNINEWENDYPIAFNFVNSSKGNITLLFSKTKIPSITDINSVKQYLRENNLELYYQLATPTTEIVENCVDIDLDTYQEKTYFNILNSLPGTLDFKVPSNIGSVVKNMAKEVNNIWDVINNLLVPGLIDVNKTVAMATIKNNLQ